MIKPPGTVTMPNQTRVIQKQFPSWHGCPVLTSVSQAPVIAIIIGEKAIVRIIAIPIGSLVK